MSVSLKKDGAGKIRSGDLDKTGVVMNKREERLEILRKMFKDEILGHKNIKTKEEIRQKLGCDERSCRDMIQWLRVVDDMPIVSLSTGNIKGSFLMDPTDPIDRMHASHYLRAEGHRRNEIQRSTQSVKRRLSNDEIIPSLFDKVNQVNNGPEAA